MNPHLQKFIVLHQELENILKEPEVDQEFLQQKIMKYIAFMSEEGKQTAHRQHTFDYFCEHNGVNILSKLLQLHSFIAIKAFSLLFINLKDQTWINFILCQPFVMQAIQTKCDDNEQQWTQYYISFLKSLSIRMNESQISVFYNKKSCTFPIVFEAMKYFNHPDFMVRTSVMNIILQLMKIKQPKVVQYFSRFPFTSYLVTFGCEVHQTIKKFNIRMMEPECKVIGKAISNYHVDLSDYLYYFNDLINFGTEKNIQIIRNSFFAYITIPLFQMLLSKNDIEIKHAILIITECFKIIKDKRIVQCILLLVLCPKLNQKLINKITIDYQVYQPLVYQQEFKPNNFYWDQYKNDVLGHCLGVFKDVEQFDVYYEGLNHEISPEFLEEVTKMSNFINYDLLENKQIGEHYPQSIYKNQADILQDNPFRSLLLKLLEKGNDDYYELTLALFVRIIQNKNYSKMTLMMCEIQRLSIELKYIEECQILLSPFQSQFKNILFDKLISFNTKETQITHLQITIRLLKMLIDMPFRQQQQQQIYRKYKQITEFLMTFITKQNIIDLVQNFSAKYQTVTATLFSQKLSFQINFETALMPQNLQQKKQKNTVPKTLSAVIAYHVHQFWLYRAYIQNYFQHFYDTQYSDLKEQYQKYFNQNPWTLGERFPIRQRKTIACDMIRKSMKKPKRVAIIEDPQIFLIAQIDGEGNQYKIIVNVSWVNISFEMNRDQNTILDTSIVMVGFKDSFSLIFDDQVRSSKVLANFNDMKWQLFEKELSFIYRFIKNILKHQ